MGQEEDLKNRGFKPYQVNSKLISACENKNVKIMHCLPAHRGMEITSDVLDGPNSIVWQQAENRLHTQKALLYFLYSI